MARRRNDGPICDDLDEEDLITSRRWFLQCSMPLSVPRSLPQVYGGSMTIVGSQSQWSRPIGPNNMKYLKADSVRNLEVTGSIPMNSLERGKTYKGVFEVSLAADASGWSSSVLVTIEISIPDGSALRKTYNVVTDTSLTTSTIKAPENLTGSLTFTLHQKCSSVVKKGLIIKRFLVEDA